MKQGPDLEKFETSKCSLPYPHASLCALLFLARWDLWITATVREEGLMTGVA